MALKLSGMAAKNFALFVYAVLKDQKKIHGKTRLVRMLKELPKRRFFNKAGRNGPANRNQIPRKYRTLEQEYDCQNAG